MSPGCAQMPSETFSYLPRSFPAEKQILQYLQESVNSSNKVRRKSTFLANKSSFCSDVGLANKGLASLANTGLASLANTGLASLAITGLASLVNTGLASLAHEG